MRRPLVSVAALAAGLAVAGAGPGAPLGGASSLEGGWAGSDGASPFSEGVVGARFSVSGYSNTVRAPRARQGVATLRTRGRVNVDGSTKVRVSASLVRASGKRLALEADGLRWTLDFEGDRLVLELTIRVRAKVSRGCRKGARGVLRVVDDDTPLATGPTSDSVTLRFGRSVCRAFAREWSNEESPSTKPSQGGPGGGNRARVEISLDRP